MTVETLFGDTVPRISALHDRIADVVDDYMTHFPDASIAEVIGALEFLKINLVMAAE